MGREEGGRKEEKEEGRGGGRGRGRGEGGREGRKGGRGRRRGGGRGGRGKGEEGREGKGGGEGRGRGRREKREGRRRGEGGGRRGIEEGEEKEEEGRRRGGGGGEEGRERERRKEREGRRGREGRREREGGGGSGREGGRKRHPRAIWRLRPGGPLGKQEETWGVEAGGPPAPELDWRSPSLHGVWEPVGWTPPSPERSPPTKCGAEQSSSSRPAQALSVCPSAPGCASMLAMDPVLAVDSGVTQQGPGLGGLATPAPDSPAPGKERYRTPDPWARWSAGGLTIQSSRRRGSAEA